MIRALVVAAALGMATVGAQAQVGDAQGDRMAAAYQAWASRWSVQTSSFAAMRGDKVVATSQVGEGDPYVAAPLASLSKAITGVCVAKLVETGRLTYRAKIGKVLKRYFRKAVIADQAAKDVTVAELLTHSSGIHYDPTQGSPEFLALDFSKPNLEAVVTLALSRPLSSKTYFYNNADYAALGLVIEAVTGETYRTACKKLVLRPAGVTTASMDPDWRIMSSWGGWNLSAVDYARFLDHFRPGSGLMTTRPHKWPQQVVNGEVFYSLGTLQRRTPSGKYDFSHAGAWYFTDPSRPERDENYGSYFVVMEQDLRFVATYSPQPGNIFATWELEDSIRAAAYPSAVVGERPAAVAAPAAAPEGLDDGGLSVAIATANGAR